MFVVNLKYSTCVGSYRFKHIHLSPIFVANVGNYKLTREPKGAKAPIIPFKNRNNNSGQAVIVKSNEINSITIFYISLPLSPPPPSLSYR
jgi:hypothetical protein